MFETIFLSFFKILHNSFIVSKSNTSFYIYIQASDHSSIYLVYNFVIILKYFFSYDE